MLTIIVDNVILSVMSNMHLHREKLFKKKVKYRDVQILERNNVLFMV